MPGVEGRVALVTGAAQGIGAAVARRLSQGGASVAVLDLQQDSAVEMAEQLTSAGGPALGIGGDVSRRQDVQAAVDRVVARFGGLHILVNNAGVMRDNLLFKMSDDDWDTVMDVHLAARSWQPARPETHGRRRRYGGSSHVFDLGAGQPWSSQLRHRQGRPAGLTKTLAIELGPFGVTVNAIAPGFIETAMTKATAERIGTTFETDA